MLLQHLDIVFNHLSLVKLNLLAFLFVFVGIFRVFIVCVVSITVNANLENFSAIVIGTGEDNGIFEHLERFGNCRIGIEMTPIISNFESYLSTLSCLETLLKSKQKFLIVANDLNRVNPLACSTRSVND